MEENFRGYNVFLTKGYPCIWEPDHELAIGQGFVYIHRLIAYEEFDDFEKDKIVHHKDGDKTNWDKENLELVSDRSKHIKNHSEQAKYLPNVNGYNEPEERECSYDECDEVITVTKTRKKKQDNIYCSKECNNKDREKIDWPKDQELLDMVEKNSYLSVSEELGVSDNAIRNRLRARDLI